MPSVPVALAKSAVPRGAASVFKKSTIQGKSWETGEVPSSAPQQDSSTKPTAAKRTTRTNANTSRAPPVNRAAAATRSNRSSSTVVSKGKGKGKRTHAWEAEDDDDDDPLTESDDEYLIPKEEDDNGTEPADDEDMDANFDEPAPSTRKRKRATKPARSTSTRASSKVVTRAARQAVTPATSTRAAKRLRSMASSIRGFDADATRVFALWKQDGHFYSGTVYSHESGAFYRVKFDDGTEGLANLDQMRACEPRVGDDVLFGKRARTSKVVDVSKAHSDKLVSISVDDEIEEVGLGNIRIASKTISYSWKDRALYPEAIISVLSPVKPKLSPSPSKLSMLSGVSARSTRRKLFANTGLVVTLSAGNQNWSKDKTSVMSAIKNTGGAVIDDWQSIIRMDGKHFMGGNRWVINLSEVKWNGNENIERVFLLADDSNQKPKFLIALALGIPCVSLAWLYDSVEAVSQARFEIRGSEDSPLI